MRVAVGIEVNTPQAIVMRSLRSIYYRRGVATNSPALLVNTFFLKLKFTYSDRQKNKMKKIFQLIPHQYIALLGASMIVIGLFWGRAIMASGMIMLLCNAVINKDVAKHIKILLQHKVLLSVVLMYICLAISVGWSSNQAYTLHKLQLHLPMLALPLGILSFTKLSKQDFYLLIGLFIIAVLLASIWSTSKYISNKDFYINSYSFGQVIPVPFKQDHIRFSLAVVLAIHFCIFLFIQEQAMLLKILVALFVVWLSIYLHILAVKTGLLSFYILLLTYAIFFIKSKKQYTIGLVLIALIIIMPTLAFKKSETFRKKVYYTWYSMHKIMDVNSNNATSDEGRLLSYALAIPIIKQNFALGVGVGDMQHAMEQAYIKNKKNTNGKILLPHNQLLVMQLAAGILGSLSFVWFMLVPWLSKYKNKLLLIGLYVIFILPLMVEPMHETQYGIAIHLFFFVLIVRYLDFVNTKNKYLSA
jgi:O-antigen ligase